ncbi:immunoglobulin E-set [Chaetomium tenue]|uniref:Immunoglobulin E-set n=1 Tax=Chaetomium tenue TaxID=1854479 RepID=A0ACB7P8V7_9PEZI|nr:immunoglobulin E-set [Chaetomium globosum]
MSFVRRVSFREPDPASLGGWGARNDTTAGRPVRCRSPYPHNSSPEDDEEDTNDCHESEADTDDSSDEGDESLQRYKQSLGLAADDLSDPNDPRVCIIQSLTMESPGRDPVVIDLSAPGSADNLKKHPFKIKGGAVFTMSVQFKVQHEILSGLHYVQVIKRKGLGLLGDKSDEMIGSFAPNTSKQPLYTKKFQEESAPSSWAARGHYFVSSSFVDDDKKTHLQFDWAFEIDKDW